MIQSFRFEFNRVTKSIDTIQSNVYDMKIINKLYRDSALILPHRPYIMLSSKLYTRDHVKYLDNDEEKWDLEAAMKELKLIHFSN